VSGEYRQRKQKQPKINLVNSKRCIKVDKSFLIERNKSNNTVTGELQNTRRPAVAEKADRIAFVVRTEIIHQVE